MKKKLVFPIAKRPLEYVAFFTLQFTTKEGPAYLFIAVDAYSEFAFHLGVEADDSNENYLKYIYQLTENPDFRQHRDKGFTLVLENHEDISEQIIAIIHSFNGSLIFDKAFNRLIGRPVLRSLADYMKIARK